MRVKMKKVVILINSIADNAPEDELDVLNQVCFAEEILEALGYETYREFMNMDFPALRQKINQIQPTVIFNLVEGMDHNARVLFLSTGFLDALGYPYTGNTSIPMFLTNDKVLSKEIMTLAGIPTPPWFTAQAFEGFSDDRIFIAKPIWEDASVGIDDYSVFKGSEENISRYREKFGSNNFFLETYVEGREFNISVIEYPDGPRVLHPAEMCFCNYPKEKPRIVGYTAKWDENSFEYQNTRRSFELDEKDTQLIVKLEELAYQCWDVFHLCGYARIDFRVDNQGNPWVLDINANPCLSPDAGLIAACRHANITEEELFNLIIKAAIR